MSTEYALNKIPVRINAIAPGVYASEMTYDEISPEDVGKVAQSIVPVPAERAGLSVYRFKFELCYELTCMQSGGDGRYCHLLVYSSGRVHERTRDCHRRRVSGGEPFDQMIGLSHRLYIRRTRTEQLHLYE